MGSRAQPKVSLSVDEFGGLNRYYDYRFSAKAAQTHPRRVRALILAAYPRTEDGEEDRIRTS